MRRHAAWATAAGAALLGLSATVAHAHGGPPAALGIVAADTTTGTPSLVLLNEGLAVSRAGRWSFLCPQIWGDANTSSGKAPLALSLDGVASWVIGTDDLYLARDGVLTAQGRPGLSSAAVVALAADDDALYALSIASDGSALVRIDADVGSALFKSSDNWSALASESGRLHLGRSLPTGELGFMVVDRTGQVLEEEFRVQVEGVPAQLQLRPTAQRRFAVVLDGAQQYTLGALDGERWQVVAQSLGPIQGPLASANGQLWISVDGELMRAAGDEFEAVGEVRRVTCLEHWGSMTYACVGSELYRFGDEGLGERFFDLQQLDAPDPELVPEPAARVCDFQWLLFENDLERSGLAPPLSVPADAAVPAADSGEPPVPSPSDAGMVRHRSGGGCSAVPASSAPWSKLALAGCSAWLIARLASTRRRRA